MSKKETPYEWIERAKQNGWTGALRLTLDALAPLGVLGAQAMWVLQPTLGTFFGRDTLHDLASILEDPDELAQVRRQLDDDPPSDGDSTTN